MGVVDGRERRRLRSTVDRVWSRRIGLDCVTHTQTLSRGSEEVESLASITVKNSLTDFGENFLVYRTLLARVRCSLIPVTSGDHFLFSQMTPPTTNTPLLGSKVSVNMYLH